jgi:predicted RNase H-like HicB family nuclease
VCRKGLVNVSETYTAVYERDGEAWSVEIAEEPCVHSRCPSVVEARESIRDALARWLKSDPAELRIVDSFRLPAQIRTAQQSVKATRTEHERNQLMASMTDSRSAMSWAEDLGMSMRDPVTVQALKSLGDREVSIDTFCHTITMAEELSRLTATGNRVSPSGIRQEE